MMKTFVKLGMMLGVAIILHSTTAFAQTPTPRHKMEDHKDQRAERFAAASKRLNLTDDQQSKIKELLDKNRIEMKSLREANKDASKDDKRKAMINQMKQLDGQINGLLDAKQQTIYTQMKAERKNEMQQKRASKMKERQEMDEYPNVF